jgi:hypothetical protein
MGERRDAYKGKYQGKRTFGRPRRTWERNIRMNLTEIGWERVDWIDLVQGRDTQRALVNTAMNIRFPPNAGNFDETRKYSFLKKQ